MKKIISVIFSILFLLSSFCFPTSAVEEEDDMVYVLAIGNSYSNNAILKVSNRTEFSISTLRVKNDSTTVVLRISSEEVTYILSLPRILCTICHGNS